MSTFIKLVRAKHRAAVRSDRDRSQSSSARDGDVDVDVDGNGRHKSKHSEVSDVRDGLSANRRRRLGSMKTPGERNKGHVGAPRVDSMQRHAAQIDFDSLTRVIDARDHLKVCQNQSLWVVH